jgi:hypothetical protein
VEHRHLLPNEVDLLLDDEAGFGVQPLRTHVRRCAECRAELEEARALVSTLEHLPHFQPAPAFAERVMANVQVFEPWHVAAADSVRRWMPRSRPARVLAGAMATSMALLLSVASFWLATRLDVLVFFSDIVVERGRTAILAGLGDFVGGAFGEPALQVMRTSGTVGVAVGATGLLVAIVAAALGLRVVAGASRRRRS